MLAIVFLSDKYIDCGIEKIGAKTANEFNLSSQRLKFALNCYIINFVVEEFSSKIATEMKLWLL